MKQLTFLNSLCISEKEKGVRSGGRIPEQVSLYMLTIFAHIWSIKTHLNDVFFVSIRFFSIFVYDKGFNK